ncbi:MAG TPA: efflux RND transporter periplasmic adaptor subunit [Syntrophales bacterium]|nr:efflux RND transporter periplasmic adaptor subunit [Syntrophales bacterium]
MKIFAPWFAKAAATALVLSFALTGCGQAPPGGKGGQGLMMPEVSVTTIETRQIVVTTELTGRTSAFLVAEVRPQVSGIVKKRLFTEGSEVKEGQVLFQIDPVPFETALENARAAKERAEANLPAIRSRAQRAKELLADRAVSQQEADDAAAAVRQAEADIRYWQAAVEAAKINLGYTAVKAPISGRIGKSNVTEGALVTAMQPQPLATIQQLNPVYVDVPQSTTELLQLKRRLKEGRLHRDGRIRDKVRIVLEDGSVYPLPGTLEFRDVTVDPTTGSVNLRVLVPNPAGTLLPGMFVRALVEEGLNPRAILVPQQAVMRDPKGNPYTLVVDPQGKVEMRYLVLERTWEDQWLVSSGLSPGEKVVMEGVQKIRPGMTVKTVPFTPAAGQGGRAPATAPAAPAR